MSIVKSILKTLFIFFIFIFTLSFLPQSEGVCDTQYIQNDYQKVILVSNSIYAGEIIADKGNNSSNSSLNNIQFSDITFNKNNFSKNSARYNREFIHNLSTNLESEIAIRAP